MTFEAWRHAISRVAGRIAARTSSGSTTPDAVAADARHRDLAARPPDRQRPQHGIVLDHGGDHVIARPSRPWIARFSESVPLAVKIRCVGSARPNSAATCRRAASTACDDHDRLGVSAASGRRTELR